MHDYVCASCGKRLPGDALVFACPCGGLLDLDYAPDFDPESVRGQKPGMWRYAGALPVPAEKAVSFDEGFTPLLPVELGGREVLVKQDQLFATGSYKDRGASVMISQAAALGIKDVVEDSSGNAGCAVAAYCARAGMGCRIFVPADTSPAKTAQISLYGARLELVPGSREATAAAALAAAKTAYYASHCYNPYFFHGTKTFAYEVAEQLGWRAPEAVILPAGNGTLLLGAAIGFSELAAAGVIEKRPRLIAVQAENCSPLARAFSLGLDDMEEVPTSATLAEGIAIAAPVRARQMLAAVRETDGEFLTASEEAIKAAFLAMAKKGFYIEPTSAAVIAGAAAYAEKRGPSGALVTVFTGHGLKAGAKLAHLA